MALIGRISMCIVSIYKIFENTNITWHVDCELINDMAFVSFYK